MPIFRDTHHRINMTYWKYNSPGCFSPTTPPIVSKKEHLHPFPQQTYPSLKDILSDGSSFVEYGEPEGVIKHVPKNVLSDQYGMLGLAMAMKFTSSNGSGTTLMTGESANELGLDLSTPTGLLDKFAGPFGHVGPMGPEELKPRKKIEQYDFIPVIEARAQQSENPSLVRRMLIPAVDISKCNDDTLFYIFYQLVGDSLQMLAASELYKRNWRYDTVSRFWITRLLDATKKTIIEREMNYERGYYKVFDCYMWKQVTKELHVEYQKLEGPPPPVSSDYLKHCMYPEVFTGDSFGNSNEFPVFGVEDSNSS